MSTSSVAPAVATRTTAASNTSPFQQRIAVALAIAELEHSLTRLELRLLPPSRTAGIERRRQHLLAASVHALDALLPK